jgi:hypothetical protein
VVGRVVPDRRSRTGRDVRPPPDSGVRADERTLVPARHARAYRRGDHGRVVDEHGGPLANRVLSIEEIATSKEGTTTYESRYFRRPRTDEDGGFDIRGFEPGRRYRLRLNERRALEGGTNLEAGATGLQLVAVEGTAFEGTLVDENGGPIAGAVIEATEGSRTADRATTDAAGRFRLVGFTHDASLRLTLQVRGRKPQVIEGVAITDSPKRFELGPKPETTKR